MLLKVMGVLTVLVTAASALTFKIDVDGYDKRAADHVMAHIERSVSTLDRRIGDIESDLRLVTENGHLQSYLDTGTQQDISDMTRDFSTFVKIKQIYDQARYIDETGMERVRVDLAEGGTKVTTADKLQNKGTRYFFTDTMKLGAGEVFISPFDLNIEGSQIEIPYKPMVRLATPLFGTSGQRRGIVILNYLGIDLLQHVGASPDNGNVFVELLNRDGYWLKSQNPKQEWGFMFDDKKQSFATDHPEVWLRMQDVAVGQMKSDGMLWTWARIYPLRGAMRTSSGTAKAAGASTSALASQDYYWTAVSQTDIGLLAPARLDMLLLYAGLWLGAMTLVALVSWMIALRQGKLNKAQKTAQDALQRTELLLSSVGEGICGIDATGKTIFVNSAARQMFGWSADEGLGLDLHAHTHHHHADGRPYAPADCRLRATLQDGKQHHVVEDWYWRKDGSAFPVEFTAAPIKENGKIVGAVNVFRDISSRKETEASLWEAKERLEAAASAGIVGVWDWDIPNNRLIWDKVMYRLYGRCEEDFAGAYEAWASALHPDDRIYTENELKAALRGECEYSPEFRVVWPDGSIHHIKAASHTTFDDQGKPLRMIGVNYDQTEQKNIEAMLEEGITKRTQELQKASRAAEVANLAKSAFLANMSHEMRTPMHQITGLAELIRRGELSPKQTEHLDKLAISCRNLTAIIDTILELTRVEAGQFDIIAAPLSLEELLDEVIATVRDKATAKHLRLVTEVGVVPGLLVGDKNMIRKALLNYVTNAISFTDVGSVMIRVKPLMEVAQELLVRFEVEDTGMGIAPEDLPRLFSIFEQVDMSSTRKFGGIGLGLAMTRKMAEIMGGEAGCESKVGEGSTFWFSVRLKKSATTDS